MREEEKTHVESNNDKKKEDIDIKKEQSLNGTLDKLENIIEVDSLLERADEVMAESTDKQASLEQLIQESRVRQKQQKFELVTKELSEALEQNSGDIGRLESEVFELAQELVVLETAFEQVLGTYFAGDDQKIPGLKTRQQILELIGGIYEESGKDVPEDRINEI